MSEFQMHSQWVPILAHWFVSGAALYVTAALVPGFRINTFGTALIASLLIGASNVLIRPLLIFLTFPLTVLTLGFFIFVVDAIILRISSFFLDGFEIRGWFAAIIAAVVLSILSSFIHSFVI